MFEQSEGQDAAVYERRQIFSTDKFTSLPTGIASPGHTGREAGIGHGNKEVWNWKRKGEVKELLKSPSLLGLHDVPVSPGIWCCNPSTEGSTASACRMYGTRGGPACVHQSNIRWHFCHLIRLEWTTLLLLLMTTTVMMMMNLIKVKHQTDFRGEDKADWTKLFNSHPWPTIWECAGRSWLDGMSGQMYVRWFTDVSRQAANHSRQLLHSKDIFPSA